MAIPSSNPAQPVDPNALLGQDNPDTTVDSSKPVDLTGVNESLKSTVANAPVDNPVNAELNTMPEAPKPEAPSMPGNQPAPVGIESLNALKEELDETATSVSPDSQIETVNAQITNTVNTTTENLINQTDTAQPVEISESQPNEDLKLHSTLPENLIDQTAPVDETQNPTQEQKVESASGNKSFWFKFIFLLVIALILGGLLLYLVQA